MDPIASLGKALEEIKKDISKNVDEKVQEGLLKLEALAAEVKTAMKGQTIKVRVDGKKKTNDVTGLKHRLFEDLIKLAATRHPILLVGMAGTGKTQIAEQVSEGFDLPFYSMSVGAQTSKSDIIGYMHANGGYVPTLFRKAFEEGGVFLMDEIDAGNANVLIQINSALANGYCAFPDKMIKRHEDFIFIASANTFGHGANRQYVGRNQLDSATLDRFYVIEFDLDDDLEMAIAKNYKNGEEWVKLVRVARKYAMDNQLQVLITPRATIRGATLLASGFPIDQVVDTCLLKPFPRDKQKAVLLMIDKHLPKKGGIFGPDEDTLAVVDTEDEDEDDDIFMKSIVHVNY